VNVEFNSKWKKDAIDAQVIAARTYGLYQMERSRTKHFDLDSDVKDQMYAGSDTEDSASIQSSLRTQGQVLKDSSGKILKAFYHSTCGGMTELPEKVWGTPMLGFKRRAICHYCKQSPSYAWSVRVSKDQILKQLQEGLRKMNPAEWKSFKALGKDGLKVITQGSLKRLQSGQVNPSGRVDEITLGFEWNLKTYELKVSPQVFRNWIGTSQLKSTAFQIYPSAIDQWTLQGRGFGHGVGLCQYGAKQMGEKGYRFSQILSHYYPDAVLAKAW
jgi:stage II sporulation protein D